MNTTAKGIWKPVGHRSPMIANGLGRHSLGQAQLAIPLIAILTRFALPLAAGAVGYGLLTRKEETTGEPKTLGIENWKLAYSALIGGVGAAAWIGGSILPENVRPISTAVGVLGTAGAIGVLFWPDKDTQKPDISRGYLPLTEEQAWNITAELVRPIPDELVPLNKPWSGRWSFPITIRWHNRNDTPVTVPFEINTSQEPKGGLFTRRFEGVALAGMLTLNPRHSAVITYDIPNEMGGTSLLRADIYLDVDVVVPGKDGPLHYSVVEDTVFHVTG